MLTPPHAEGGIGAVRVEVRGWYNEARHVEVIGVSDRIANIAGTIAAASARGVVAGGFASGVRVIGDTDSPNDHVLSAVVEAGIHLREFVGTSSH
jgi:hypothetical protein